MPRSVAAEYREAGFKTKGGAVLLPKQENVRHSYNPETRHVETHEKIGPIKRTSTRLKYGPQDAHKFIRDADAGKFDNYKGIWAFYYYGNQSLTSFDSLKELAAYLNKYTTLNDAHETGEKNIPQFSLVQWHEMYVHNEWWRRPGWMEREGRFPGKAKRKRSSTGYRHKMKEKNPAAYQRMLDEDAARKREARAKGGKAVEIERHKDRDRKRAQRAEEKAANRRKVGK